MEFLGNATLLFQMMNLNCFLLLVKNSDSLKPFAIFRYNVVQREN